MSIRVHLCSVTDLVVRILRQMTCCVDVFDLNYRIQAVIKSIQINTMFARYMTHCKTSSVVYLIYHSIVVFEDVS